MTSHQRFLPLLFLILFVLVLFKDFIISGKLPLPGDTLIGAYFPWLDYKWGFSTGVPVKNPITSDAFSQFFVWKKVLIDSVLDHQIPLWNPTSLAGSPLMASFHTSVFNPANLLLLVPKIGWGLYIFSSTLLAVLSIYLYLSLWVKNKMAISIAAIVYSLSGPMTTWTEFGTAVFAAGFFPLVFYFLHTYILKPQKTTALLLPLSIALLIFSGHVQLFTYAVFLIPIYLLYLKVTTQKPNNLFVKALVFCLLGFSLGAIQLLPSKEFFSRSIRSEEHYSSTFNYGLTPISQMIRLWSADFFGHPSTRNFFSDVSYHENSSFVGILTLPFLIYLWLKHKARNKILFPTIIFISTIVLAVDNPISRFIFALPFPLFTYSSASRIFFVTNFSIAILLALGLEEFFKTKSRIPVVLTIILIMITVVCTHFVITDSRTISQRNIIFSALTGIAFFASWLFLRHRQWMLAISLFILFSFDLGRYFHKYNTFFPVQSTFPTTPTFQFLLNDRSVFRIARQDSNLLPPNTWSYYGLESIEGYDPLYSSDYAHFFNLISGNPYTNGVSRYAILGTYDRRFLDALNVKYYLSVNPKEEIGWKKVFTDKTVSVYENQNVLPRAYFAKKTIVASSQQDLISHISSKDFDPRSTALILERPSQELDHDPDSQVKIDKYSSQSMSVKISTKKASFLIISNSYDPGWRIYINGKESKLYKTNGSLIGVEIGAGESHLDLIYLPASFVNGAIISLISLFILVISLKFV